MLLPSLPGASGAHTPAQLIRARIAVYLVFLANGLGVANLVPRYPEIVAHLDLSKASFGQAVAATSVGALMAGLAAPRLISRFTSARVASLGMVVVAAALAGAAYAQSWLWLALCLLLMGGTDAVVDVGQNAHGLRIQRHWGSSIVTSFHAAWSLGAVLGAAMGQAAAGAGIPPGHHMLMTAVVLALLSAGPLVLGWFLPGDDDADRPQAPAELLAEESAEDPAERTSQAPVQTTAHAPAEGGTRAPRRVSVLTVGVLVVVSLLCAAAMFPEDVGHNWSSLLLAGQGAAAGQVGLGIVAIQGTMIVGRLVGDRVVDALGARAVIAWGGVLVVAGMGLALVMSSVPGTLIGMAISGVGCAVAVPVTYSAGDDIPGLAPGQGLTIVSWLARAAGLIMPPVVGWLSDSHGLWVALAYGLIGGLVLATCWPVLRRRG
ncbi:MFS transporter [Actinomyces capricornis]|uniref:MFS transporter n=1 Tax=Actinomyces capricornis TaxID=2755559 RepID=A0ABN6KB97_9ACTO|nr:MFS transporter [Actinomyces capricornis]BDA65430.1 MFS transporter [Actinomyces capricornis]